MDDLLYFPSFGLVIKIRYAEETNSLRYATNREISEEERKLVESYILNEVGPKTGYYAKYPSILLYMGIERNLDKELKLYQLKDTFKDLIQTKSVIDQNVKHVIAKSLSNYYFERVGDELVKLRTFMESQQTDKIDESLNRIIVLLDAYNQNTGKDIEIQNILPKEALKLFE